VLRPCQLLVHVRSWPVLTYFMKWSLSCSTIQIHSFSL
jgi:hypothetical protein